MNNKITFSCTSLAGINKVGNLRQNAEGYYPMVVGALNMFNSAGHYYPFEAAKSIFEESSVLMRRVSRGALRGEYGHPRPLPGQKDHEFARRVLDIDEKNVCCHHMKLTLDFDNYKDAEGRPLVAIISEVQPNGPYGHVLEKQLQNKNENVCFSIRAMTNDKNRFGVKNRVLKNVVTFDYVNEPGMAIANKYQSPALESLTDIDISRGTMEAAFARANAAGAGIAQEAAVLNAQELFASMGWTDANKLESLIARKAPWAGW